MSALSDLLSNAAAAEGISARGVAERARGLGHEISDATATAVLGGRHTGRPQDRTLAALADALHLPLGAVREAAGLPADPGEPWVPPAASRALDADQRRVLDDLVRVMARQSREELVGHVSAPIVTTEPVPGRPAERSSGLGEGERATWGKGQAPRPRRRAPSRDGVPRSEGTNHEGR